MSLFFPVVGCQYSLLCVCDPGFKGHGGFLFFWSSFKLRLAWPRSWNFLSDTASLPREGKLCYGPILDLGWGEFTTPATVIGDLLWSGPRAVSYSYSRDTGYFLLLPFPSFIFKCALKWWFVLQLPSSSGLLFHEEESFKSGGLFLFSNGGCSPNPSLHSHERASVLSKYARIPSLSSSRGLWRTACKQYECLLSVAPRDPILLCQPMLGPQRVLLKKQINSFNLLYGTGVSSSHALPGMLQCLCPVCVEAPVFPWIPS